MKVPHQSCTLAAVILVSVLCSPAAAGGQFQTTPTTFSGQATAIRGTVLGIPIVLVDTGPVAPGGGSLEAHLLCYPDQSNCTAGLPDMTAGMLSAQVINATVVAQGDHSRARASVADLSLNVAGQTISATFLEANAHAQCADGTAFVQARADLATVVVNNQTIAVTGDINQHVDLPLLSIVINEQTGGGSAGDGDITVTALHITIPGTNTDLRIAEAHADIHCGQRFCPSEKDFVTGGGWLPDPRRTFAVAGGIKNGAPWGHLLYDNHATGTKVKGTGVVSYTVLAGTARHIEGTCEVNGTPCSYAADVDDRGEPGHGTDILQLTVTPAVGTPESAGGLLGGGNLQLHTCK